MFVIGFLGRIFLFYEGDIRRYDLFFMVLLRGLVKKCCSYFVILRGVSLRVKYGEEE